MRILAAIGLALVCAACGGDDGSVERPLVFGGARPVELQIPTDFDGARTYPLLIILHGYSVNGYIQQSYFRLFDAATTYQMLVLAPEGTKDSGDKQFWNADPACCNLEGSDVDDVAYLGGVIDDVMATWPVDPARVMLIGHSNGAFMAYRMACDRADVVTAIAGLAGHAAAAGVACAPSRPVDILHMHGTADDEVPYQSGTFFGVTSPGAVDSVAQWAAHNGCAGAPTAAGHKDLDSTVAGDETAVMITGGCPASGAAELWTIEGANHIPTPSPTFSTDIMAWLVAHPR